MTGTRDLSSTWGKVGVAKDRMTQLEQAVRGYLANRPAEIEAVRAATPGHLTARVKSPPKPLPREVQGYLGDTIHNLRDALDHLAHALVGPRADEETAFPIYRWMGPPAVPKLMQAVRRRLKGASPAVISQVIAMELYENGKGDGLWRLHQVAIVDKHQRSVVPVFNQRSVIFDATAPLRRVAKEAGHPLPDGLSMPVGIRPKDTIPLAAGSELFSAPEEWFENDYGLQFAFELAFDRPLVVQGRTLIPTLSEWLKGVESAITSLDRIV